MENLQRKNQKFFSEFLHKDHLQKELYHALIIGQDKIKNAAWKSSVFYSHGKSDSALNLVGAEASGTSVHMAGSSVNHSLDPLHIGLPGTVGTSVRVGDLDTKSHALAAKITLRHSSHLLSTRLLELALRRTLKYNSKEYWKMQALFFIFFIFSKIYWYSAAWQV